MSLGVPLSALAKQFLRISGVENPTDAQVEKETQLLYSKYEQHGKDWLALAPKTLFVIASGNDGQDNDALPTFPANVEAENKISVGASQGFTSLATFSNYGEKTVDIVAPGVAELSSVPHLNGKEMLPMSGTSMAAPYIAGVASKLKDINKNLTAVNMKNILMSTVDKKDWLKSKVVSEGVVNPARAYKAAELSLTLSVDIAIQLASTIIPDVTEESMSFLSNQSISPEIKKSAGQFIF